MLCSLCTVVPLSLSPAMLLTKMQAHYAASPLSKSDDSRVAEFQPDPQYRRLRGLLSVAEVEAASDAVAAKGTSVAAAEIASMGPLYQRAATDGELLEEGVEQMLDVLRPGPGACLADLGSGRAEALLHVAARGAFRGCFGVELVEARHLHAERTLAKAKAGGMLRSAVRLEQGDFSQLAAWAAEEAEEDAAEEAGLGLRIRDGKDGSGSREVRLRDVTHVWACSVCYDDMLLRSIADALSRRELFPRFQVN